MAEEAIVLEKKEEVAAPESKTPTIDEAILAARSGKPTETPVAETKPEVITETKPEPVKEIPQGESSDDEFNIDDVINELEAEPEKPTEQKQGEPTAVKDSYSLKDIASLFKVEADSLEGIQKAVEAKVQLQAQSVSDETKPLRDLDTLIALDDKTLISQIKKWDGFTDEEVAQYLESSEESKGKAGIRNEALEIRVNLRKGRDELAQQVAQKQEQKDQSQKKFESMIRSKVNAMDNVFGVPVSKEDNETFATEVLKRDYDEQMKDPDKYLSAMRLVRDFAKIKETVFKNGAKAGAKQMKQVYESKLHNKDLGANNRNGKPFVEEKEVSVDSNVDAARRYLRERNGIRPN